jgi:hypothetical protein
VWIGALILVAVSAWLLAGTEERYVQFIQGVSKVDVRLLWTDTRAQDEKVILGIVALFENHSDLPMWVEALNTQLYLGSEYAGAYSISEGRFEIPPQGEQRVPLQIVLWKTRARLFDELRAAGEGELIVRGRARIAIQVGSTSLKVFYRIEGTFSIAQGGEGEEE